jgi:hypothetical protein
MLEDYCDGCAYMNMQIIEYANKRTGTATTMIPRYRCANADVCARLYGKCRPVQPKPLILNDIPAMQGEPVWVDAWRDIPLVDDYIIVPHWALIYGDSLISFNGAKDINIASAKDMALHGARISHIARNMAKKGGIE